MRRKIESGDCVRLAYPYQNHHEYGRALEYDKKAKTWSVRINGTNARISIPASELSYIPSVILSTDFLKSLVRYEITYADFAKVVIPSDNWDYDECYEFTLDDMTALLRNIKEKRPTDQEFASWIELVFCELEELYWVEGNDDFDEARKVLGLWYPMNDAAMARCINNAFFNFMTDDISAPAPSNIDIDLIFEDIENYRQNLPIRQHLWSLGNKLSALGNAADAKQKTLSLNEKNELRAIILELASQGYPDALRALGYAYYGGDDLFPCDWDKSRDCFLQLLEIDCVDDLDKCQYANTLGYIYYYGRCNNGIPEYEKAYQYYAMGAAGGLYESMYKLSDMYSHGYGVSKNTRAATTLVNMVYTENLRLIQRGRFDCQFADAALRMGNLCRNGILHDDAHYYYMLADFAIRKRLPYDHYGDANVFAGIQKELAHIREEVPLQKATSITCEYIPTIIEDLFSKHSCFVTLTPLKKGIKITVKRLPQPGCYETEATFECYPKYGYCNLVTSASIVVFGPDLPHLVEKQTFIADGIEIDWSADGPFCSFTHHGEKQFSFSADKITRKLPVKSRKELTEYQFASVIFSRGGHTYDYICEISEVAVGDKVIVNANGEDTEVQIVRLFKMVLGDMPLEVNKYKKILRKV